MPKGLQCYNLRLKDQVDTYLRLWVPNRQFSCFTSRPFPPSRLPLLCLSAIVERRHELTQSLPIFMSSALPVLLILSSSEPARFSVPLDNISGRHHRRLPSVADSLAFC
ncbi:hypothetical protein SLA2020_036210 [Shorea laevis]